MHNIERITPFPTGRGSAVAGVKISCGPVVLHAKLRRREECGSLYLCMPAHKTSQDKWFDHCYIKDPQVRQHVEAQAVLAYQPWVHGLQANPTEITHQYPEDIWVDAKSPAK